MFCGQLGGPYTGQGAPGRLPIQKLPGSQIKALLQYPAAEPDGFFAGAQSAAGFGGAAAKGDSRRGGEPGGAPMEGRYRLRFRVLRKQAQQQLLHGVTVVMTDEFQIHRDPFGFRIEVSVP